MTTCNTPTTDPELAAALELASYLIDTATRLGAELRANRFTERGYDLALQCRFLGDKLAKAIYGPDEGIATDSARSSQQEPRP